MHPIQQNIADNIAHCGLSIMSVFATQDNEKSFAYTIGLTEVGTGHREVIVFGLPHMTAGIILNELHEQIKAGLVLHDGDISTTLANLPLAFKTISDEAAAQCAVQCLEYYRERTIQPKFFQLVLCDRAGKFPWDADYDRAHMDPMQPELWTGEPV